MIVSRFLEMNFRSEGKEQPLFEYLIKIINEKGISRIVPLFPAQLELDESTGKAIRDICFPLIKNDFNFIFNLTYTTKFKNPTSESGLPELFASIRYVPQHGKFGCYTIYCLVSKFSHLDLQEWILNNCEEEGLLNDFHHIEFKKTLYDIEFDKIHNCPFCNSLSVSCELAKADMTLLKRFPPYYLALIIAALFVDSRIVVVSSNLSTLSRTVFALSTLLYPFSGPMRFCPLLTASKMQDLNSAGPYIFGIHSSMLQSLDTVGRNDFLIFNADEPYIFPKNCTVIDPVLNPVIESFHKQIQSYCMQSQPVFPGESIRFEYKNYVRSMICAYFGCQDNFRMINDEFEVRMSKNSSSMDVTLSKSSMMYEFMTQSVSPQMPQITEAYWPFGTDRPTRRSAKTFSMIHTDTPTSASRPVTPDTRKRKGFFIRKR